MPSRRRLLAWLVAIGPTLLLRRAVARPVTAFAAPTLDAALEAQYAGRRLDRDPGFTIEAPASADNAAQVPVRLQAGALPVRAFTLFAEHNPVPLLGRWQLAAAVEPWLELRIKLAASGRVCAVAELTDGTLRYAETRIEVGAGACG